MNSITILRGEQKLAHREAAGEVNLLYHGIYQEGDRILFMSDTPRVIARVDQSLSPARLYLPTGAFTYALPLAGDNLKPYPPQAFMADMHHLSLTPDTGREPRNLAENPLDQRGEVTAFPHATANVETRDESVFCARNVLDGLTISDGHGPWPYQSWGIGARQDAWLKVDFGREVILDELVLYLRSDFPHDAWWIKGSAVFSDGSSVTFPLTGIGGPQRVALGGRRVRWLRLEDMVKCDMPSAFPSLRQLMAIGRDADA